MKYRMTIEFKMDSPTEDIKVLAQNAREAVLQEAKTSHLLQLVDGCFPSHILSTAATKAIKEYHRTWADALATASCKLEEI
jgi:hypothetical protein